MLYYEELIRRSHKMKSEKQKNNLKLTTKNPCDRMMDIKWLRE